jgi:ubiquinone/menaquinone biosynthesis C-methylase UbiE
MAKDLFSKQAEVYARYRPTYPAELFDYILSFVTGRSIAWDCATGNGQAAVVLAQHFKKVIATDISEKQLQQAIPAENIEYSVASAEKTTFPENTFDLITVAQAYHWFNFNAFHDEVMRVATQNAIIAVWGYNLIVGEDEKLSNMIGDFYRQTVGPYWDNERKHVEQNYSTVSFNYDELPSKEFRIYVQWTKEDVTGYLNTWSSVQHFIKANQYNPVEIFSRNLQDAWPQNTAKQFYFPLFLRLGKIHPAGNRIV